MKLFNFKKYCDNLAHMWLISVFYLVIIALLGFSSCTTFLELDDDFGPDQLVVSCLFNNESRWRVLTNYSFGISSFSDQINPIISDATVTIYDAENRLIERLIYGQDENLRYYFLGNTMPEIGKFYFVEVINGGNVVRSTLEKVPTTIPIKSFILDSSSIDSKTKEINAKLTFDDPINENNYYYLEIASLGYRLFMEDTFRNDGNLGFNITNSGVTNGFSGENSSPFRNNFFADKLFEGQEFTLELKIQPVGKNIFINKIELRLHSISASYFDYLNTRLIQNRTRNDPFAQPTQIYSNIENGLGIFAGYSTSSVSLLE